MQAPLAPQWFQQPTYEWVPVTKNHYQTPYVRTAAHPWSGPSPWYNHSPNPWMLYFPNPWANPSSVGSGSPWSGSSLATQSPGIDSSGWHAGSGEKGTSPNEVTPFASDPKPYRPLQQQQSAPVKHRRVRELQNENVAPAPKVKKSPASPSKRRNLLEDEFNSEDGIEDAVPVTPRLDRQDSGKSFLDKFSSSRKRSRPLVAIPLNEATPVTSSTSDDVVPSPKQGIQEVSEPATLDPFLTNKTLNWDIRDLLSTARDYSPSGGYSTIPLDRPAGLSPKVNTVLISVVNEEHAWVKEQWGPVIVQNAFGPITLGDIFKSISMYFGECLREEELKTLLYLPETAERVERAWLARHKNPDMREYFDTPGVYRRMDMLCGPLKFHALKIRWTSHGVCELALLLRDL